MPDLLSSLNPQQRAAVEHGDGPMLVFAGAGSGKTRVITHRIAHRIQDHGVEPWSVLAVTFTNKAAAEMRARIEKLLGGAAKGAWIGTFHATCARLLRMNAAEAGLDPHFVVFDDGDQQAVLKKVIKELDLDDRRFSPRWLAGKIDQAKQECRWPDDIRAEDPWTQAWVRAWRAYEDRMKAARAVDFGDLLARTVLMLEQRPEVLARWQDRFRHVLIDEFQDTNHAQYRLVRLLAGARENVCAVGDDDQSIYRWRGADIRNIRSFRTDFAETAVFKLEQNYRSTRRILAAAQAVISRSATREPKELFTENPDGAAIDTITLDGERAEGQAIVEWIRAQERDGIGLAEIAIFYRVNAQSRVIEEALRTARIRYAVYGGMRFYERAEIKDVIAYLRLIQNPHSDVDVLRVINVPPRGIGKTTIDALDVASTLRSTSVWDALGVACEDPATPNAAKKRLQAFREMVEGWRAKAAGLPISALTRLVLDGSGYDAWLEADPSIEAESRRGNVAELVGSMEAFETETTDPTLPVFLETVALQSAQDEVKDEDRVSMMTVHTAKGLEFSAVAVAGLEEELFPLVRGDPSVPTDPEDLEEERRLCYVAITRARQRLLLTNVVSRRIFGQQRWPVPSRFLGEIPAELTVDRSRRVIRSLGALSPPPADVPRERVIDRSDSQLPYWDEDGLPAFRVGQSVRHARFGIGRVRAVEPGADPKLRVDFPEHGTKVIVARFVQPA